ncbi:MAG: DNA replication and repair protein RecF [Victivallales bacterium]|nr:DNA replication and repair protein RecF [Victivallales bacterium]
MLTEISIKNFRNIDQETVSFAPGLNCIVGPNGQGKTNLLEAVSYLSLLRSFRTTEINDLRQWKRSFFLLKGHVDDDSTLGIDLAVNYGDQRKLQVNSTPVYRASDFINQFLCVSFIPEDLRLVQGSPSMRRRLLDITASQVSPLYLKHLQAYQEALHSRNVMLKDQSKYPRAMITAYDHALASEGAQIEVERHRFVQKLNDILAELSPDLLHDDRILSVKYLSRLSGFLMQEHDRSLPEIQQEFYDGLQECYERDCKRGTTTIGPHHSDFSCLLGNLSMQRFSSQGECRLASLALRLATLRLICRTKGDAMVTMLIDDVIGELDASRRAAFFQLTTGIGQCLLACTELPPALPAFDQLLHAQGGHFSR